MSSNENESNLVVNLKDTGANIVGDDDLRSFISLMSMDEILGPPSSFSNMAVNIANNELNKSIIIDTYE